MTAELLQSDNVSTRQESNSWWFMVGLRLQESRKIKSRKKMNFMNLLLYFSEKKDVTNVLISQHQELNQSCLVVCFRFATLNGMQWPRKGERDTNCHHTRR